MSWDSIKRYNSVKRGDNVIEAPLLGMGDVGPMEGLFAET
jgi:hypothetical protein